MYNRGGRGRVGQGIEEINGRRKRIERKERDSVSILRYKNKNTRVDRYERNNREYIRESEDGIELRVNKISRCLFVWVERVETQRKAKSACVAEVVIQEIHKNG
jgi:hypothetical protein